MSVIRKKRKKRSLLKRLFKPNYRFIRREYYSNINVISQINDLNRAVKYTCGDIRFTDQSITFRNLPFGTGREQISAEIGLPRFEIDNSKHISDHIILFFKEKISGFSLKIQVHFVNNQFFFADYLFNSSRITRHFKDEIISVLTEKYNQPGAPGSSLTIIDPSNNKLVIQDDVVFDIRFVSGSPYVNGILKKYYNSKMVYHKSEEVNSIKKLF